MFFEQAFLLAYAVTIISEVGIILAIQRPKDIQWWITGIVLGNSFTHPIVLYLLFIRNVPYIPVEVGVFFIEACWYRWAFSIEWERAVAISAVANIFSIIVGAGVRAIFGL